MIYPNRKRKLWHWPRPGRRRRAGGFSLMEAVVSVGVTGTLMGGMISVMSIASRAAYNNTGATENTYEARDVVSQITTDISLAEAFTERTSTVAAFSVPDRDGDGLSESIRYEWSGNAGGTLTRRYNGGPVVTVAENVHHFNLGFITKVVQAAPPEDEAAEDATFASVGDTTLYNRRSLDSRSYGGAPTMAVGLRGRYTGLVGFDLSGVDYTIGTVKLRLYVTRVVTSRRSGGSSKVSVYPMVHTANNASWYEGTAVGQYEEGAACNKYRSYQSGGGLQWENASGTGQARFQNIRGPEIGSIDPESGFSVNQWIEIPLSPSAVEAYCSCGSITLNIASSSRSYTMFATKEHADGNGPELVISPVDADAELQESAEMALIEHDDAPSGSFRDDKIKDDEWAAQYFKPTLPVNTESWKITGARIRLKKDRGSNGVISVQIRDVDANLKPGSTILTQATVNESDLSSSFEWVTVNLPPAGELNPLDGFCLVVGYSSGSSTIGRIEYERYGNPMPSDTHWMTTSNSGRYWSTPETRKDMRFTVYGTVTTLGDPQ